MVTNCWGIQWIDACLTMRLLWWQQLPLLILIQLLEPSSINHKIYAEALLACKSTLDIPQQSSGRIGRYPCIRQWACLICYKPKDPGVVSLIPEICALSFAPNFFLSNSPTQFQEKNHVSRNRRIAALVDGNSGVPTFTPLQQDDVKKPRKQRVAAIVGGVGAALLVIGFVVLVYICLMRVKRSIRQTSEGESSVPSPSTELERTSPYAGAVSPIGTQNLRRLAVLELKQATNNFSESNIIGEGSFGLVYKGLLQDGSIVAIKRCLHTPTQNFVDEVKRIALLHHRHLVNLAGYCEENHHLFLVYDYIPNGNVGNHLYDNEGLPIGKLNMWQRVLIALGAAKEGHHAGSSSAIDCFLDPELNRSRKFSSGSDVYSFGVFLLELISGQEANGRNQSNSDQNLVLQAKRSSDLGNYVDKTLGDQALLAAKEIIALALQCVDISGRRPSMRHVVEELEHIQEREIHQLPSEFGEEIGAVTLGSELFK